ncbi:MAG: VOC family protein [Hyphomicrobiaceae bacterium]
MPNSPAPEGYTTLMPYLRVRGADDAVAFYKAAFGAKVRMRLTMPDDRLGHAELLIGGAVLMLSDEFPEMGIVGPKALKGTTVTLMLYVADVDKALAKAVAAGAKVLAPAKDEFYGDRTAKIEDPFGHVWSLQKQLEKLTPKEVQRRLDQMMSGGTDAPPSKLSRSKKKS